MGSPRPSFEASTLAGQDHPLLEEFTISSPPPSYEPSPKPSTRTNTSKHVFGIRLAICILNWVPIIIPVFGAPDTLVPLLPMTFFTTFLTWIPTAVVLNDANTRLSTSTSKLYRAGRNDEEVGSRRNAILVEDPITGEERWMLESKKEVKPMGCKVVLGIDIYCAVVFLVSIILSLVFGTHSPLTLGGVVFVRGVTLVLISSVMIAGERDEDQSVDDDDDLEADVPPQFCCRTE